MTHHRPIILRELPADKTTDPAELVRAAPYRYSAEWETPEHLDDETDPLWGTIGFGATEHEARADLAAQTAHIWHEQTDEDICGALGELAEHPEVMSAAIARAEQLAQGAINTATNQPCDAQDSERLLRFAQDWSATATTLRRLLVAKPKSTSLTVEHDLSTQPTVAKALGELFLAMPPEVKRSQTFGLSIKGSDDKHIMAVVATRDRRMLAEFVRLGLIEPAADTPLSDCPQHIADQLTNEVTFTAPDGRVFTGCPADVGAEVAEALIYFEGETWTLPSAIREQAAEHIQRVLDGLSWSPRAQHAAYHLYRITTAAPGAAPSPNPHPGDPRC